MSQLKNERRQSFDGGSLISRRLSDLQSFYTKLVGENEELRRSIKRSKFGHRQHLDERETSAAKNLDFVDMQQKTEEKSRVFCTDSLFDKTISTASTTDDVIKNLKTALKKVENQLDTTNEKYLKLRKRSDYERLMKEMEAKENKLQAIQSLMESHQENVDALTKLKKELNIDSTKQRRTFKSTVDQAYHVYEDGDQYTDSFEVFYNNGDFNSDEPQIVSSLKNYFHYLNSFQSLFETKQYKAAALRALQSPGGILVNIKVFNMFKSIDEEGCYNKDTSPLMFLCDGVMKSSKKTNKPSEKMCLEVIKCALKYKSYMVIRSWVNKDQFSPSINVGKLLMDSCSCENLCNCSLTALALNIFLKINVPRLACICFLRMGSFVSMLKMAEKAQFLKRDYKELFRSRPSSDLFYALNREHVLMSLLSATSVLIDHGQKPECQKLINGIFQDGRHNGNLNNILISDDENIFTMNDEVEKLINFLEENLDENMPIIEEILSTIALRKAIECSAIQIITNYYS